jgi:hypothetical protein
MKIKCATWHNLMAGAIEFFFFCSIHHRKKSPYLGGVCLGFLADSWPWKQEAQTNTGLRRGSFEGQNPVEASISWEAHKLRKTGFGELSKKITRLPPPSELKSYSLYHFLRPS